MSMAHAPWIVLLSLLVAIQGAYVGLGLTLKIGERVGLARRLTLAAAAFTFGVAIWSMHFIGMLAVRLPVSLDYLVLPTLLSLLVSVFVVGAAVFITTLTPLGRWGLPLAATVMGLGIATMHYIGMMALHGDMVMRHDPWYVAASFAVAVVASALGLRFAFAPRPALPIGFAAVLLGLAISGMHYVAMAGLTLDMPTSMGAGHLMPGGAALSPDLLAVVVAVVAFAVSAVFLLTLVPDHGIPDRQPASPAADLAAPALPRPPEAAPPVEPPPRTVDMLPVERNGVTHYVPVGNIVIVQADTHYTQVFDGRTRQFCPLSIGEVEQRLDPAHFSRVHRSFLVAIDRIAGLQRSGDGGVARFETEPPATVPVSRNRYAALKARIDAAARFAATQTVTT